MAAHEQWQTVVKSALKQKKTKKQNRKKKEQKKNEQIRFYFSFLNQRIIRFEQFLFQKEFSSFQ